MGELPTTGLVRMSDRAWSFQRGLVTYQLMAYPGFIRVRYQYPGEGWQVGRAVPYQGHPLPTVRMVWAFIAGHLDRHSFKAGLEAAPNNINPGPGVQTPDTTR